MNKFKKLKLNHEKFKENDKNLNRTLELQKKIFRLVKQEGDFLASLINHPDFIKKEMEINNYSTVDDLLERSFSTIKSLFKNSLKLNDIGIESKEEIKKTAPEIKKLKKEILKEGNNWRTQLIEKLEKSKEI